MYYKSGKTCVTNWGSFFYYKLGQTLLQSGAASLLQIRASVVTNWGSRCYKIGQLLQIAAKFITSWDITHACYWNNFQISESWVCVSKRFVKWCHFLLHEDINYMQSHHTHMFLETTMLELPKTHADVQQMFQNGFHTFCRIDKFWTGLSSALLIKKTLIQRVKISGGLTRGHRVKISGGLTRGHRVVELQRSIWLLSTAVTEEVNLAMQEFTGMRYQIKRQHIDLSLLRIQRVRQDAQKIFEFLQFWNSFIKY